MLREPQGEARPPIRAQHPSSRFCRRRRDGAAVTAEERDGRPDEIVSAIEDFILRDRPLQAGEFVTAWVGGRVLLLHRTEAPPRSMRAHLPGVADVIRVHWLHGAASERRDGARCSRGQLHWRFFGDADSTSDRRALRGIHRCEQCLLPLGSIADGGRTEVPDTPGAPELACAVGSRLAANGQRSDEDFPALFTFHRPPRYTILLLLRV